MPLFYHPDDIWNDQVIVQDQDEKQRASVEKIWQYQKDTKEEVPVHKRHFGFPALREMWR